MRESCIQFPSLPARSNSPPLPSPASSHATTDSCPIRAASLPEGQRPLKPSLKLPSLPPTPNEGPKHVRCRSAPATPITKTVHFAEEGLERVVFFSAASTPLTVRKTLHPEEDIALPSPPIARRPSPPPPQGLTLAPISSKVPRVFSSPLTPETHVLLESIHLSPSSPFALTGSVLVRNLAYAKIVAVRFSLDDWITVSEVFSSYITSLTTLPPFLTHDSPGPENWDRFTFRIRLDYDEAALLHRRMAFAIRYTLPDLHAEHWDNNEGQNYTIHFQSSIPPAPCPPSLLPSPAGTAEKQSSTVFPPTPPDSPIRNRESPLPEGSALQLFDGMPASLPLSMKTAFGDDSTSSYHDGSHPTVLPNDLIQRYCYFQPMTSSLLTQPSPQFVW